MNTQTGVNALKKTSKLIYSKSRHNITQWNSAGDKIIASSDTKYKGEQMKMMSTHSRKCKICYLS